MNESPHRQSVLVGLFVAIGLAIFAGGVATIGGLKDQFSRRIHVEATFDDVAGLAPGDSVWFSGVPVGTVSAVTFGPQSQVEVEMAIGADASRHIPTDAYAKIGSDGLIGNTIVVIEGGDPDAGALKDGEVLEVVTTPSTEAMFAMLQQNNENLLAITENLQAITSRIAAGQGTVGRLLQDDQLYAQVKDATATLESAATHARVLTSNLAQFSERFTDEDALPNRIVSDTETWTSLTASVDRLENVTTALEQTATGTGSPVGVLLNDEEAAQDLGETLENLNVGSQRLAENMEALQHNFLLRGFFRRRDRERDEQQEPAVDADAAADQTP